MFRFCCTALTSFFISYILTFHILRVWLTSFEGVSEYLPLVCAELSFFFWIISYSYTGVLHSLTKNRDAVDCAKEKGLIEDALKAICYKGKPFIYEVFSTNIRNRENTTGKQAREFIDENELLSTFTHISLLKNAPAILTSFGLGCTFLAILIGLKEVKLDSSGLMQGIAPLVSSLSAKFLTSLVALACAILLNFYTSWYFSKLHSIFLLIKRQIDNCFPMESIGKIISENLMVDLDLKELRAGLASACKETATAIDEQLNSFKQLISSGELQKQIESGNNMIGALSNQIIQLQKNTEESAKFLEKIAEANNHLNQFSSQIENLSNVSSTLGQINVQLQQDKEQMAANYNEIMKQLPEMTDEFAKVCVNMRNNLQNNYAEAIETAVIKALEGPLQKITESLRQAVSTESSSPKKDCTAFVKEENKVEVEEPADIFDQLKPSENGVSSNKFNTPIETIEENPSVAMAEEFEEIKIASTEREPNREKKGFFGFFK